MNGVAGLNVRTLGVSRDMIMSAALALGGKYLLCQDDPDLVARAAANGLKVVYRQSGDETLSLAPAAFVNERAKNAPAAAYIHLTNELDPTPELLAWTMEAMKYADSIKRKVCILNYSTHRSAAQWQASTNVIQYGVARGHAIGLHIYTEQMGDSGAHHYHDVKRQVGGTWILTEFGFARDAYHGWRGSLSQEQYAAYCKMYLPSFAAENMPVLLFSYDHWMPNAEGKAHGFGVNDAPTFLSALAGLNAQYPLKEKPVPTPTPYPPGTYRLARVPLTYVNLRAEPSAASADLGDLYPGTFVELTGAASGDWVEAITADKVRGWVSLQGGNVVFEAVEVDAPYQLGIDVSQAQALVDWHKVKAAGYSFAFVRATQGKADSKPVGADTKFRQHIDGALAAGIDVGAYHSFIASVDGKAQAEYFYIAIAPYLDRLAFPPVIDVELTNRQTPAKIADRLREMSMWLELLIKQKPMIYCAPGWWNSHVGDQWDAYFATLALWIAAWTSAPQPTLPRPWKHGTWTVWQFANNGKVDGVSSVRTDLNRLKP